MFGKEDMRTGFWWGNAKEGDLLDDLRVLGG